MAYRFGKTWGAAVWTAAFVCLGPLGCQAPFSYQNGAPLPPPMASYAAPPKTAAPGQFAVAQSAKPSTPDASFGVTPGLTLAANEMGVAALTGNETGTNSYPAASTETASASAPAPVRPVPHYAAAHQPTPPLAQTAYTSIDSGEVKAHGAETTACQFPPSSGLHDLPPGAEPRLVLPSEKAKSTLPAYVIEPPDVLVIDGIRLIPKSPYRIEALDVLFISVPAALPGQPIVGPYTVTTDGTVSLGFGYGSFRVLGMTLDQAAAVVKAGLRLNNPQVSVALAQFHGIQQVRGEHIVGQDGTISLGSYGCVNVTGLTVSQAKCEIERHLARWLQDPLISVSIGGYNSKVYYVITDGAGFGQQVYRFPITGNETVLDAISMTNGLPPVASKRNIWLARPTPAQHGCYQILPVNWEAITEAASTETNWQLFPGDRIYVKADPFITFDNTLAKVLNPIERLFGATLLGTATVQSFHNNNNGNNNGF